ncbi:MAG: U32 family peptidase [Deltaproteobacteria bacterium]|nr:U32 family peptidase [Deltaproteobacteria bacterium]
MRQKPAQASPGKPELLAPAGSLEKCKIAYLYGADAVYVGGKEYSLRAFATNFTRDELAAASRLAHESGKKLYVTVNTFARQSDLESLPSYLQYLQEIQVDALIVSDPGVILLCRAHAPTIPIHLSTQANTTNALSVLFWKNQGISRINLARELSIDEIKSIRTETSIELEIFVHGAMCVSYSGRCLLSAFLNDRSANRGLCTQPCRWSYRLVEEKRPGQYFPIAEDTHGSYIFNSKDLCLLQEMGLLMSLGIEAFKIEGRMKGVLYLASVVRAYRQAIDAYWQDPDSYTAKEEWRLDLEHVSHRPYSKGLLFPEDHALHQGSDESNPYCQTHTLAGIVREHSLPQHPLSIYPEEEQSLWVRVEVRSRIVAGMTLEFLYPDGRTMEHTLNYFEDLAATPLRVAQPNTMITFPVPFTVFPLQVIRMEQPAGSSAQK